MSTRYRAPSGPVQRVDGTETLVGRGHEVLLLVESRPLHEALLGIEHETLHKIARGLAV
jgi:hypothetical protein